MKSSISMSAKQKIVQHHKTTGNDGDPRTKVTTILKGLWDMQVYSEGRRMRDAGYNNKWHEI